MDISIDVQEFSLLARSYNVVPVSKVLLADLLTPVSAYLRLRQGSSSSFLFESVEGGEHIARYSFIGRDPHTTLRCKRKKTHIDDAHGHSESYEDFFSVLETMIGKHRQPPVPALPRFAGGLVGFLGYDAIRFIEDIPCSVDDTLKTDDSIFCFFTSLIVFDHYKHQILLLVNAVISGDLPLEEQYARAVATLSTLEGLLRKQEEPSTEFHLVPGSLAKEASQGEFTREVCKAKEYIHNGDIYQVVLSQRFSTEFSGDTFHVYRALRVVNPSPYLYFLDFNDVQVIGSSPEVLVRAEQGVAETYPIAGTRRRGATDEEDRMLERELIADEKERAEHIMLVDLARNDLGKVCEAGSVRTDDLMHIVRYSHVMHIATHVSGKIAKGKNCIDLLRATFPAGTVSGAPKIRAMEIIDELESIRRGMYAGGVGYLDFSGNMDICIAIRTMMASKGCITYQAGAGIVADSDPESEYQETINKSQAMMEALLLAERIPA